jgi:hypothetical protein
MPVGSAPAFFAALAARVHEPRLADATGTWEFDIEGVGTWTVAVDHGALSVADGTRPPSTEGASGPRTRFRMREDELLRLLSGDGHENLFMGVIRGAIVIEGALAFGQRLQAILPLEDERSAPT